MRRFHLQRTEDLSGKSGTGVVAQGVQFDDGSCAMRWLTDTASTAVYASAADVETIHGHEGRTRLVWLDQPERARQWRVAPSAGAGPTRFRPDEIHFYFQPDVQPSPELLSRRAEIIQRLRRPGS